MQATEKHSERRSNGRRHDDKERRRDSRRHNPRRCNPRRDSLRLNRSFEVSVLDYDGKTVNICAGGVYFEVITNDIEAFPIGTSIPLQINAVTNTHEGRERKFKFNARGTVIRNCIIKNQDHANTLGVALEFTEKLNTELHYD